jgi:hypothetical protein
MMLKRMRRMTLAVVLATVAGGVVALSPAVASAEVTTTTVAPTSLVFDGKEVGTTSSEALVTVNGIFEADPVITGDSGDFWQTNNCGRGSLGGWSFGSCIFHVTFTPSAAGLRTATLTVRTGALTPGLLPLVTRTDSVEVSLTGTGVVSGKRAAALKKCEKKRSKRSKARKSCIKKANKLPV